MKFKVCCNDRMCFYVETGTWEPISGSFYDAWCFNDPEENSIHYMDWLQRVEK